MHYRRHPRLQFHLHLAALVVIGALPDLVVAQATRDPFLWPFADTSIWNMPIGKGAHYHPVELRQSAHAGVDIQHILRMSEEYPERPVYVSPTWGPGRCGSTTPLGFSLRVPDDWLVPDAGKSEWGMTPNSNFAFLLPDGETVFEGSQVSRCEPGGPVHLPEWMKWPVNQKKQPVRGDGLGGGGQGASGMSALGGTLRLGELTGRLPLRHAIKINPYGAVDLYYGPDRPGFRWPAVAADHYAAGPNGYKGKDRELVMGSLLAIPPSVDSAALGLTTAPSRLLFRVLRDYGAYFTEDAAWDTWDLIVERGAEKEFEEAFGFSMDSPTWKAEVNKLISALAVVANNGPDSIGGGGEPRVAKAPPFTASTVGLQTPHPQLFFQAPKEYGGFSTTGIEGARFGREKSSEGMVDATGRLDKMLSTPPLSQ